MGRRSAAPRSKAHNHTPRRNRIVCIFLLLLRREKKLFTVECEGVEASFAELDLAMAHAKLLNKFVVITGDGFEVVGKFGVDSIQDGVCPDGVAYDWNKASRIGRVRRERV